MYDNQTYRYWSKEIGLSEKQQPVKEWEAAEARLQIKKSDLTGEEERGGDEEPYVNGWRLLYESLKSFLDQRDAMFNVMPAETLMADEYFLKRAQCEAAYLKYVWREQKLQQAQSQKLDSALQRNVGYTLVGFDKKKWLPTARYLPARDVLLDSSCGGLLNRSNWMGYKEYLPIEEFKAQNKVTDKELESLRKHVGSNLSELDHTNLASEKEDKTDFMRLFDVVTVYNVFARNASAVRKVEDGEVEKPSASIVDELNLTTPKLYLKFVKGIFRPVYEGDWPYDLDDDEFPITQLKFNTPVENLYGYTDNRQMRRLDILFDAVVNDLEHATYREGRIKVTGPPEGETSKDTINAFLNDKDEDYIPGLLAPDGKPKIVPIEQGKLSMGLVKALEVLRDLRNEASALGELSSTQIKEYKEVTALAARLHESNVHQKINRRLNGPEGYEVSIQEDAIKIMEIAHQLVPKYSLLEVPSEMGNDLITVPWEQALVALRSPDVSLIKLGIDAIVGAELAEFWMTTAEEPIEAIKLSTKISIVPGSTRRITEEERAAVLKQYYQEVFFPLYQAMNRWDLAVNYLNQITALIGLENTENFVPTLSDAQQFMQMQQQMAEQKMEMEQKEMEMKQKGKEKESK